MKSNWDESEKLAQNAVEVFARLHCVTPEGAEVAPELTEDTRALSLGFPPFSVP